MFTKTKPTYILATIAASLFISACITTGTHAAGTANAKTDFGAVGDGVADDTAAIRAAFNSDYDTIIFPEGDYHFARQLDFGSTAGDKVIIGEKATLLTDDDFYSTEVDIDAILINQKANITFKGIRFEARQTEVDTPIKTLVAVRYSSNIHFDSCDFSAIAGSSEPMMNGIDFWTGWHDVSVKNSTFNMLHDNDDENGSALALRDIQGVGASNAEIINNTAYKQGRDEIFYILELQTTGTIDGVTIAGNRFYIGDSALDSNVFTATFSSRGPAQLRNINIYDNEIIGRGENSLFEIEGSENLNIYDNDLYQKVTPPGSIYTTGTVIGSRCLVAGDAGSGCPTALPNTPGTVNIQNNRTITIDSPVEILALTHGNNPFNFTGNKHVVINAPLTNYVVNHSGDFSDNNVTVNGDVHISSSSGGATIVNSLNRDFQDNYIYIDGFATEFFKNWTNNLTASHTITNNTIITTKKRSDRYANLIQMWDAAMNDHTITFSGNTFVNGADIEDDTSLSPFTLANMGSNISTDRTTTDPLSNIFAIRLTDSSPSTQNLYFCDNTTKGFHNQIDTTWGIRYPTFNLTCN